MIKPYICLLYTSRPTLACWLPQMKMLSILGLPLSTWSLQRPMMRKLSPFAALSRSMANVFSATLTSRELEYLPMRREAKKLTGFSSILRIISPL